MPKRQDNDFITKREVRNVLGSTALAGVGAAAFGAFIAGNHGAGAVRTTAGIGALMIGSGALGFGIVKTLTD